MPPSDIGRFEVEQERMIYGEPRSRILSRSVTSTLLHGSSLLWWPREQD
jgi:hypothetical protein